MYPRSLPTSAPSKQAGFLIPLALFILVGMLALALAASRLTGQSNTSATLEGLSTQAFYAAESGGQYALHQLLTNSVACASLSETVNLGGAPGLRACTAQIGCQSSTDADSGAIFYTVTSEGECGSGDLVAQRAIQIMALAN